MASTGGKGRGLPRRFPSALKNPGTEKATLTENAPKKQSDWITMKKKSKQQTNLSGISRKSTHQTSSLEVNIDGTQQGGSSSAIRSNQVSEHSSQLPVNHNRCLNGKSTHHIVSDEANNMNLSSRSASSQRVSKKRSRNSNDYPTNKRVAASGLDKRGVGKRGPYKGILLDKLTNARNIKLEICIPPQNHYRPVGENERYLSSYIGHCVRSTLVAPCYPWKYVETEFFDEMMDMIMDYFEVSEESPPKWKIREEAGLVPPDDSEVKIAKFYFHCKEVMQACCRRWRFELHQHYLQFEKDGKDPNENIPKDVKEACWKEMVEIFKQPTYKEQCSKNVLSRKHVELFHCSGPIPFQQTEYTMIDGETGELPLVSDVWKKQHAYEIEGEEPYFKRTPEKEIYNEILAMEKLPRNDDEPPLTSEDILTEVLGTKSGRVCGKGSGFRTTKRVHVVRSESAVVRELRAEIAELRDMVKNMGTVAPTIEGQLSQGARRLLQDSSDDETQSDENGEGD